MYNIATIYRFNTPFLDLSAEQTNLISVIKKIEKSIDFEWIKFDKKISKEWLYNKVILEFCDNLWKIEFFYISQVTTNIYHLPVFKLNIFLNNNFLLTNFSREKTVKFLNNIFECFDWLNEKEFLIDIDNTIYYKSSFFASKIKPVYDFSDIEKIRELFESNDWLVLVEDFITKFAKANFELTYEKSDYYHKLHGIFLYFIYLVFLMYQNLEKTHLAQTELDGVKTQGIFELQIDLMKERLSYIKELHENTFEQYKNRLELFFKMF